MGKIFESHKYALLSIQDFHGCTAFHDVAQSDNISFFRTATELSLELRAKLDQTEPNRQLCYDLLKIKNHVGETAVNEAVYLEKLVLLECFLDSLTSEDRYNLLSVPDDDGDLPAISCAVFNGETNTCSVFLQNLDPHQIYNLIARKNHDGDTLIHHTAYHNQLEITELLLRPLSNVHRVETLWMRDVDERTAEKVARDEGHTDMATFLQTIKWTL